MILLGLVLGRWWKSALIAATLLWPVHIWMQGVITSTGEIAGAAVLVLLNSAVGAGAYHLGLGLTRVAPRHWPRSARDQLSSLAHVGEGSAGGEVGHVRTARSCR